MSSSMPEDVQYAMYRTVPGLENVKIVRNAYAIEYDCIDALQLKSTLEFKKIKGLFAGGQFNGSSGYEEAAATGNNCRYQCCNVCKKMKNLLFSTAQKAYIGVLIDDLVTKESTEPYRMMTSRAEYRLILRQDNADLRLSKYGHRVGLINDERMAKVELKEKQIAEEVERVKSVNIGTGKEVLDLLEKYGSTELKTGVTLAELVKRPELNYEILAPIDKHRPELAWDVAEQVNINLKYEGYIERQLRQVEHFKKLESKIIPDDIDYNEITGLRKEAMQKLNKMKPRSIGQASRNFRSITCRYFSSSCLYGTVQKKKDVRRKYLDRSEFQKILKEINVELTDNQCDQFDKYYEILVEWNKVMNLTGITQYDEVLVKHFVDSLAVFKAVCELSGTDNDIKNKINYFKNVSVIDVGTGAGFPGVPIKIAFPETDVCLLDSLNKRVNFLNEVINQLGIKKVDAIHSRAEDGARNPLYREKVQNWCIKSSSKSCNIKRVCTSVC